MTIQTNLIRRGNQYYFRARVPADLLARIGRGEFRRTLGTASAPTARARAARARILADGVFERVRGNQMLTEAEIAALVTGFYEAKLEEALTWRHIADQVEGGDATLDEQIDGRRALEQRIIKDIARGRIDLVDAEASAMLFAMDRADIVADGPPDAQGRRPTIINDEVSYLALCRGLMRALLEATRKALAEDEGNFAYAASDPLFAPPPPPAAAVAMPVSPAPQPEPKPTGPAIGPLVEKFIAEKTTAAKVGTKTQMDYRASLGLFLQRVGKDTAVTAITEDDVVAFKDDLLLCPTNFRKRLGTYLLAEAIRLNAQRAEPERLDTLNLKTVNDKYLSNLKTFFDWARRNKKLSKSPADEVRAEEPKGVAAIDEREPFSPADLRNIFNRPAFTGCQSPSRRDHVGDCHLRNHHYWTPLLGLLTGCRMNEIGQLTVDDVEEVNGIPHLRITNAEDDKRIKTAAGKRWIPIHGELVRLGFLRYVASIGSGRLFPEWGLGNDGYYSSVFSKAFGRFLEKSGLKTDRKVFHSFRHTFADALDEGMEVRPRDYYMGHQTGHVRERYGSRPPKQAWSDAFLRLTFPVDLSHLQPFPVG